MINLKHKHGHVKDEDHEIDKIKHERSTKVSHNLQRDYRKKSSEKHSHVYQ